MGHSLTKIQKQLSQCGAIAIIFVLFAGVCRCLFLKDEGFLYALHWLGTWHSGELFYARRMMVLLVLFLVAITARLTIFPVTAWATTIMSTVGAAAISFIEKIVQGHRIRVFDELVAQGGVSDFDYGRMKYQAYSNRSVEVWLFTIVVTVILSVIIDLVVRKIRSWKKKT